MRLLHPDTIRIISTCDDDVFKKCTSSRKQIISHAWSEVFKFIKGNRSHPKMFIDNEYWLGTYLAHIKYYNDLYVKCNLDYSLVDFDKTLTSGFKYGTLKNLKEEYFDKYYLFSDACSLYYKGVNIYPEIFGNEWRKYVPIESLEEIQRQVNKTIDIK